MPFRTTFVVLVDPAKTRSRPPTSSVSSNKYPHSTDILLMELDL